MNETDYIAKLYDFSLNELMDKHGLSIRAFHTLSENGLTNLGAILSYLYEKKSFLYLKKLGLKTESELIQMCKIYALNPLIDSHFKAYDAQFKSYLILKDLSDAKKEMIDAFLKKEAKKLKTPVLKALVSILDAPIDFDAIYDLFFVPKPGRLTIPTFGKNIQPKINDFIQLIEDYALKMVVIEDELFEAHSFFDKLVAESGISDNNIEPYLTSIKNRRFPIYTFVNHLFLDRAVFDERDHGVMKYRLGYFQEFKYKTLEEMGHQFHFTRERMRQIEERLLFIRLDENLAFLNRLKPKLLRYSNSPMGTSTDYRHISEALTRVINQSENCSFTVRSIAKILAVMYSDTHILWVAKPRYFKGYYLIDSELATAFDFSTFIQDMQTKIDDGIHKETRLNLGDYLSRFLKAKETHLLTRLQPICGHIISEEVPKWINLDSDGHIVFQRNTKITLSECLVQLLEEQNEPMYIEVMQEALHQRYSNISPSETSLLSILCVKNGPFIYYGKKGLYGLRKWATERIDIKAGLIQQVAADYLSVQDSPVPVSEVVEYVLTYRPHSTKKSIFNNLTASKHIFQYVNGALSLVDR